MFIQRMSQTKADMSTRLNKDTNLMNSIWMLYLHPNHQLHKLEMEVQFVRRHQCVFGKQAWRHGSIRLHLSPKELKLLEPNSSNSKKDYFF